MNRWLEMISIAGLVFGCAASTPPADGSQTHFLKRCEQSCAAPYDCLCGVCTVLCDEDAVCAEQAAPASCVDPVGGAAACDSASRVCDVVCVRDADCGTFEGGYVCDVGRCRPPAAPPSSTDAGREPDVDAATDASADPQPDAAVDAVVDAAADVAVDAAADADAEVVRDAGAPPLSDAATDAGVACDLAPEVGSCDDALIRYYYDSAVGGCRTFIYGGCEGNGNNFETLSECESACGLPLSEPCSVEATDESLPGVHVHLEAESCRTRVGQGLLFNYLVELDDAIDYTAPDSGGACGRCGGYTDNPLSLVDSEVGRGSIGYCVCDVGCCPPTTPESRTLAPGSYEGVLNWPGQQWYGPSDTATPLGADFPVGTYDATVTINVPGVGALTAQLPIEVFDDAP